MLTYQGELIEAVYFSSSGGHTADNDAVWNGKPLPYLRGVPDPYDDASAYAHWRTTVPRNRLLRALSERPPGLRGPGSRVSRSRAPMSGFGAPTSTGSCGIASLNNTKGRGY